MSVLADVLCSKCGPRRLDRHVESDSPQEVLRVVVQEVVACIWEVAVLELLDVCKGHILHLTC